jgi:hypothetical protein
MTYVRPEVHSNLKLHDFGQARGMTYVTIWWYVINIAEMPVNFPSGSGMGPDALGPEPNRSTSLVLFGPRTEIVREAGRGPKSAISPGPAHFGQCLKKILTEIKHILLQFLHLAEKAIEKKWITSEVMNNL